MGVGKLNKTNFLIRVIVFVTIFTLFVSSAPLKLDNNDIDTILNDPIKRTKYLDCLRGTAPCTEDGKKLKDAFKEVIKTNETNSVEEIKIAARKTYDYIINQIPNDVRNFMADVQSQNDKFWDRIKDFVRKPINWLHKTVNDDDGSTTSVVDMYQDGPTIVISSQRGKNWNNFV